MEIVGTGKRLTPEDFSRGAQKIGCEVAVLQAVTAVEARGRGFDDKNRPIILPEPHVFYRNLPLPARSEAVNQRLAYSAWKPGAYPATQDARYDRLAKMIAIDESAALAACSWGIGQVLGENFKVCGLITPQELVLKCLASEGGQLDVMVAFILGSGAAKFLRSKEFEKFAFTYNGAGYAKNLYHKKLEQAYAKLKTGAPATLSIKDPLVDGVLSLGDKGDPVRALQIAIGAPVDGDFGPLTKQIVTKFQDEHGLEPDGVVGARTGKLLGLTFWR